MEVPGYQIKRTIGQGGMGTVYLATQESLGRDVCLKILNASRTDSDEYAERFLNEARIVASLRHPHIITIYDVGATNDVVYIAMEYVGGGDLKQRLEERLPPRTALELLLRVGGAVDMAHQGDIIHRDVKPANILFRRDGTPLLSDFGIAKQVKLETELTSTGTILGSPFYMSPEQAEGIEVDGRTDIYSLGIILYEMLTGERPYLGDTPIKIIMQHLQQPLPTLPEEHARFQPLLERMVAKRPDDRFPNAAAMLDAVIDALDKESSHDVESTAPRLAPQKQRAKAGKSAPKRGGRRRIGGLLLFGMLAITTLFGGFYTYSEALSTPTLLNQRSQSAPATRPSGGSAAPTQAGMGSQLVRALPGEVTREDAMKALQFLADHSLRDDRLTSPHADNALYYYSRLLALDPDNAAAKAGFEAIADRYVVLAEKQYAANNDLQAQVYITLGLQVDPNNDGLAALQSFVRDRKRSTWETLLALFKSEP
ncbi:MAG: serine/threonine protein kinase [Gammaproteobacteria bacterium]|nr:serine/threonine protein kinase [Gammaproteobacteria bacterium]